ncbi:MAG: hypothetical protein FWE35_14715 [Streptosporangiales bacterium]|nr:hypothetical protein [Streptosporangiales bacterium]
MANTEIETPAARDPREQILSAVRKGHSVTLNTFKVVVDRAAPVTSKIPAPKVQVPETKLPYSDKLPSRDAVVTGTREFAGQLLAEQRKFNGEFVKTASGLHPAFGKDSAEA